MMAPMSERQTFRGQIAGVGSTSGTRVVVGWWQDSPFGTFADAMVERADGHRMLLAPSEQVAELVSTTYTFDEVRVEPVAVTDEVRPGHWEFTSPSLALTLEVGARMPLGHLLRLVPAAVSASPAFATAVDPVARVALRGVRTCGQARAGRREYYGARDMHAVTSMRGGARRHPPRRPAARGPAVSLRVLLDPALAVGDRRGDDDR